MNQEQIEQYKRDGYVKAHLVDASPSPFVHLLAQCWKSGSTNAYRQSARMLAASAGVMELFSTIRAEAEALGVRVPVFLTQPAVHVMGVDETWEGVGAHQDWPALQTGLNTVVCWIPLTDVGVDNYPVEFVPGSHLKGLLPAKPGAHYSEVDTDGMEFVPVPANFGDVIFFNVFTVHRTRTPGNGLRVAVSHRFEDASDPWYVQHGHSAQRRVIEREIKFRPTVEQVREAPR